MLVGTLPLTCGSRQTSVVRVLAAESRWGWLFCQGLRFRTKTKPLQSETKIRNSSPISGVFFVVHAPTLLLTSEIRAQLHGPNTRITSTHSSSLVATRLSQTTNRTPSGELLKNVLPSRIRRCFSAGSYHCVGFGEKRMCVWPS